MKEFPFVKIERKKYPTVIMGEDHFTGWFSKCPKFGSDKERANAYRGTLEVAYRKGVRGFSISPHPVLVKVLKKFKAERSGVVCISNHHWKSHYYVNDESLWENGNLDKLVSNSFSQEEISKFRLDEGEYKKQLEKFNFCDFFLVGNIGLSSLILLGREDILIKEIELVRSKGGIPLGICEGGEALLKIENLDVAGTWLKTNRYTKKSFLNKLRKSTKSITAYKVFSGLKEFNFEESMKFIRELPKIKSVVVGVSGKKQAKETFSLLKESWP